MRSGDTPATAAICAFARSVALRSVSRDSMPSRSALWTPSSLASASMRIVEIRIDHRIGIDLGHLGRGGQGRQGDPDGRDSHRGEFGKHRTHLIPPRAGLRRASPPRPLVNHDSLCVAGNEPAMTRVDFALDRIAFAAEARVRRQKGQYWALRPGAGLAIAPAEAKTAVSAAAMRRRG